ncbi:acyl-CoA thioester hydrolase [Actinoplanes lutulentus]|uniref:Acyl-CoA thioester hydrolase n=1 Tax=Actinoplanes lutulentus TaxID=1287878 RepID=A0A327ZD57_9ACTN|nr:acyl-CoA thioesterase [Actinoplanes lutulentus]MBB2942501.1 acyl-CoA thioester hydrolase [Actinoplanes lutulentus]RAK38082.1 acyl-CoA thioester hydrolase [Actinoplanes lutulentus]
MFQVRIAVRGYELDLQGHVNQAVYLQYGEHARWQCFLAAGLSPEVLVDAGVGPVVLETTIRYLKELRAGDEVDVTCDFQWGTGKTFKVAQAYTRADGTPIATVTGVAGLLDRQTRRLVEGPAAKLRALSKDPTPLNL